MISKEFECLYCSKDKYYNGARYVDIRYCPFCGRKIYDNDIKRKKNE